ncbi:MAG: hypothetical protein HKN18_04370 [Silicimonas sp.]|nr:hypothetical protein [Silicimonas sp.]
MRALIVAVLLSFTGPALAQSSLGITGAALSIGMTEDEAAQSRVDGTATVDVAITDVHGFQGDLRFADTVSGGIGSVGAHVYMAPRPGQKYGLFAHLSDIDGRAMTWGAFGAEGLVSLSPATVLEIQGGVGAADESGLDFIFGSIALAHDLSPGLEISAALDLADFDEPALRATSYEAGLRASYSPEGAPWGVYASVTQTGLTGRDGASSETRIGLGVTLSLGTAGGTDPHTRHFRSIDPVAPILRRGLW